MLLVVNVCTVNARVFDCIGVVGYLGCVFECYFVIVLLDAVRYLFTWFVIYSYCVIFACWIIVVDFADYLVFGLCLLFLWII